MFMLTAYFDETGHSHDERQKFNGMAGLLCKAEEWEKFEDRWDKMLKKFQIPYIHMAESMSMFADWPAAKIRKLSETAWTAIKKIKPLPIGSIIPMDDFRPHEKKFRLYLDDPYFIAMQDCMKLILGPALMLSDRDFRVAIVFSDQVEFRYNAQQLFESIKEMMPPELSDKIDPPDFRDMRRWGSLQAADMVAYEVYKEHERVYYDLPRKRRYGYERILDIYESQGIEPPTIRYHSAESLAGIIKWADRQVRMEQYWEKKRGKKREANK